MRAVLPLVAMLALAGCEKPPPAPAQPAATATPAPKAEPAAASPAPAAVMGDQRVRWHSVPAPQGLAAVFGPSESDNSSYRMECRDHVLTVWAFHEDATPPGRAATELSLRRATGEVLATGNADPEPDELGSRMVYNLSSAFFDPADLQPDLQLGVTLPGETTGWTRLNDVARDILMACSAG